jgi:hypothetical protein
MRAGTADSQAGTMAQAQHRTAGQKIVQGLVDATTDLVAGTGVGCKGDLSGFTYNRL